MNDCTQLWTRDEVSAATGGRWLVVPPTGWNPIRVSYDTSSPLPGHLVVLRNPWSWRKEIPDDAVNLGRIIKGGAVGAIVQEQQRGSLAGLPATFPVLLVPSTYRALEDLARAARRRFAGKVIAVTGTVGKTTSREMLRMVLDPQGGAEATRSNNNNRAGVYRTMSYVPRGHGYAIIEMGFGLPLDWFGPAARIVRPHAVLLTALGLAHLDTFGDEPLDELTALRRIAGQKLAILDGVETGAALVVNRAIPLYDEVVAHARTRVARIVPFGDHPEAVVRALAWEGSATGSRVRADVGGVRVELDLQVPGRGMAINALGVLATVQAAGGDVIQAAECLQGFQALEGRAQVVSILVGGGTAILLDDSFNSTPLSVASALESLARVDLPRGGRRLAVLGDINHLGPNSAEIHAALAATVAVFLPDRLFTYGPMMRHLNRALPPGLAAPHAETLDDLYRMMRAELRPGDAITLKASTAVGLMRVARALRKNHGAL